MENETTNIMNEEIMEETSVMNEQEDTYELPAEYDEGGCIGMNFGKVVLGVGAAVGTAIVGVKLLGPVIKKGCIKVATNFLTKQGRTVLEPVSYNEPDEFDDFTVDCDEDGEGNIIEIKGEEK